MQVANSDSDKHIFALEINDTVREFPQEVAARAVQIGHPGMRKLLNLATPVDELVPKSLCGRWAPLFVPFVGFVSFLNGLGVVLKR